MPSVNPRNNPKVLAALADNKVLNKDVKLEDIIRVSEQLSGLANPEDLAAWTFISPNYIYTGDNELAEQISSKVKINPKTKR